MRSLRQRLIDLEPRPIEMNPNNQLDDLHAATQFLEPDWIARCSTAPSLKCQSPLTLRSSGFDRTTISRLPDRVNIDGSGRRNGVLGRVDAHLTEVSVAFPTESDRLSGIGIVGSTSVFGAAG